MICDPLTKHGPKGFDQRLIDTMSTGLLSLEASAESQLKKLKNQKARAAKAEQKAADAEPLEDPDNGIEIPED